VLWRVQSDEPAGDTSPLRTAWKADPPVGGGLKLRYLLVVRGRDGEAEQTIFGRCMAVLDRHPVVEDAGAPGSVAADPMAVTIGALQPAEGRLQRREASDPGMKRTLRRVSDPKPRDGIEALLPRAKGSARGSSRRSRNSRRMSRAWCWTWSSSRRSSASRSAHADGRDPRRRRARPALAGRRQRRLCWAWR
jgi:hypothetical protein